MDPNFALSGPTGGLSAGFVRIPSGARVVRGHDPLRSPAWFGPAVGALGTNRFDAPPPRTSADVGVCYLAELLGGVIHERVLRGLRRTALSRATLSREHAVTEVAVDRDLVLLDLVSAPGVHGLELADIVQPPNLRAALTTPKGLTYPRTQELAGQWMATNAAAEFPVPTGKVDGILYVSRFAPAQRCVALWEGAASALRWFTPSPLGSHPDLESSLALIGVALLD